MYSGAWNEGKKNGYGIQTWTDGDKYEGQFKNNLMHGQGVYSFASGTVHSGAWERGNKHGYAVVTWANGNQYEGHIVNN